MIIRFLLGCIAASFLTGEVVSAQTNPITSRTRIWAEWDVIPNTQWAPRTIDPSASQDRSIQIFKLQPVFPSRLNDDWTVLIRMIFRFVSSPTADPVIGLFPGRLPAQLWVSPKQQGRSFRHKPHCCSRSKSGPELDGWSWFICCLARRGSAHRQREGFSRSCFSGFSSSWTLDRGCMDAQRLVFGRRFRAR